MSVSIERFTSFSACGQNAHLKPGGYFTYHQVNIHKFYVLPTQCIYVFCMDLRTNSDYFPIQHFMLYLFYAVLCGFYNGDGVCLLRGTG
jgi:hypothetical protein